MKDVVKELNKVVDFGYNHTMGLKLTKFYDDGTLEMEMEIGPQHMNPIGTVHGGAIFALGDTVGGYAIRANYGHACTTCTSAIDYFSPAMGAKKLIARAKILKHGKRMSSVEVTVLTGEEKEIARLLTRYYNLDIEFEAI